MDEGERGPKPRSHNVYSLDENSAGEREGNLGAEDTGHEKRTTTGKRHHSPILRWGTC